MSFNKNKTLFSNLLSYNINVVERFFKKYVELEIKFYDLKISVKIFRTNVTKWIHDTKKRDYKEV